MSRETFDLETKFHAYLVRTLYANYQIVPVTGKQDQSVYGDTKLITPSGEIMYAEEKASSYLHRNMVNELIQDVETQNMGWFFHIGKCDFIVYGYYDGNAAEPSTIYQVDWPTHYAFIIDAMKNNDRMLSYGTTIKNFGLTMNAYYPWELLIKSGHVSIVVEDKPIMSPLQNELWELAK